MQQAMIDKFLNLLYSIEGTSTSAWGAITGILVGGIAGVSGVGGIIAGIITAASVSAATMNPVGWVAAAALFIAGGAVAAVSGAMLKKRTEVSQNNIKQVVKRVKISMLSGQSKGKSRHKCLVDEIVSHCDDACKQVIDIFLSGQFADMVADHNHHIKMRLRMRDIGDLDNKLRRHIKKLNEIRIEANILAPDTLLANPWFTTTVEHPFALCELFDNFPYQRGELYTFSTIYGVC